MNLIAIGNGTASRETDKLAADLIKLLENGRPGRCAGDQKKVVVSEAGPRCIRRQYASQECPMWT